MADLEAIFRPRGWHDNSSALCNCAAGMPIEWQRHTHQSKTTWMPQSIETTAPKGLSCQNWRFLQPRLLQQEWLPEKGVLAVLKGLRRSCSRLFSPWVLMAGRHDEFLSKVPLTTQQNWQQDALQSPKGCCNWSQIQTNDLLRNGNKKNKY